MDDDENIRSWVQETRAREREHVAEKHPAVGEARLLTPPGRFSEDKRKRASCHIQTTRIP